MCIPYQRQLKIKLLQLFKTSFQLVLLSQDAPFNPPSTAIYTYATKNLKLPSPQGWAIQGFGQVDTIPIKTLLQFSTRYDTDTILETNFLPDMIPIIWTHFPTDTIPIR